MVKPGALPEISRGVTAFRSAILAEPITETATGVFCSFVDWRVAVTTTSCTTVAVAAVALRFPLGTVPRPPYWSGYRVMPDVIEFWHQRPFRHHDRQRFTREGEGWRHEWLFP